MSQRASRPSRRSIVVGLPLLAFAGACSSKGGGSKSGSAKAKTSSAPSGGANAGGTVAPATPTQGAAPPAGGKDLKVTIWNTGFKFALGTISYDAPTQQLSIACEVENLLSNNMNVGPQILLEADGAVISHGNMKESKEVIAKSKVKESMEFSNVASFDPAKTTLVVGAGDCEQARVPLGGQPGLRTLEPVSSGFKGDIKIGLLTYSVKQAEVRWDRWPNAFEEPKKGKAFVTFVGTFKNPSDVDVVAAVEKFVLTQPDGNKVTGEAIGPDSAIAKTKNQDDFYLLFKIDAKDGKYQGEYTLDITQDWGAENAPVSSEPVKLTFK